MSVGIFPPPSGSGAPTTVDYLVGTADGTLSAEIVAGTAPGGELGGTWGSPTVDATHSGSAHADYITKNGTTALTADWDAGSFEIRAQTFESDVATGTAPMVIASTTKVTNLNADLLDDQTGSYYLDAANFTGANWTDLTDGGATTLHSHAGGSGWAPTVTARSSSVAVSANEFSRASGTITLTLPTSPTDATINVIKNVGTGIVTVERGGTNTIAVMTTGQTSFTLMPGESMMLIYGSTATEWMAF